MLPNLKHLVSPLIANNMNFKFVLIAAALSMFGTASHVLAVSAPDPLPLDVEISSFLANQKITSFKKEQFPVSAPAPLPADVERTSFVAEQDITTFEKGDGTL